MEAMELKFLPPRSTSSGSGRGLIPSGSTSSSGTRRRGLISCLLSNDCLKDSPLLPDKDLPHALYKLIRRFYKEAFKRLPCEAMPELLRLLSNGGGGSCLGLLDPVSNIILNVIALLPPKPKEEEGTSASAPASAPAAEINTKTPYYWREVASRSCQSLISFLIAYFGCLTEVQATRYLYRADANPLLALMLIQHDLYVAAEGELFDPESDRTQAALEWAATRAGHPKPTTLANIMSIHLKDSDFSLLKKCFSVEAPLSVEHVWAIRRIAHKMIKPMFANIVHTKRKMVISYAHILEEDYCPETTTLPTFITTKGDACYTTSTTLSWVGTPISSLHLGVLTEKLQDCLRRAEEQKHYLKTPCDASSCDYLQSLDMIVNSIVHNLYIKALKLLPTPTGSIMRSILKAGHCYGCMDPLSNIIVNSLWYNSCGCDLPLSERMEIKQYNDVLDPQCLFRAQLHSLKGLTKLAAFADPQFLVPDCGALEFLCSAKCDIANTLTSSTEMSDSLNPFHEAAVAAGHPLPALLGELHKQLQLMPNYRSKLLSYITEAKTNGTVLRVEDMTFFIVRIWNGIKRSNTKTVEAPVLREEAMTAVSSERSEYDKERGKLRLKIEQLLKEYRTQQFPGPEYKLGTILGVEKRNTGGHYPCGGTQYYVNFTASCDLQHHKSLFFADFCLFLRGPKTEFCCPLPYAYPGRCYCGSHTARKIVYPDDAKYIREDITVIGTRTVGCMLGMDRVYFSPKFDVELAENLNMRPSEEQKNKRRRMN